MIARATQAIPVLKMSRAERLLMLVQALRRRRRPVAGAELAEELGVSLRTLYRDIQALTAQGAPIEGEAGVGYVLKPGFMLPPLMFTEDEIEALVFGVRLAATRADERLASAAENALAKVAAVLPKDLADRMETTGLIVAPAWNARPDAVDLGLIRTAIRNETRLEFGYVNEKGIATRRVVWPIAVAFFERARVLTAWCELRQDFRHFRIDRMSEAVDLGQRYPRRRRQLMKEWRELEPSGAQAIDSRVPRRA
jgi:predicted DNA-binding transcriptional regulator YafY